jgi:hypothetical protein
MEQSESTPKSRLIRRATIGFFAGMAVLTLFSNTIVNYSLPRVQVKNFESGMMFRQIQAEGMIAARQQLTVNFGAARIVDQVKVELGSPVLVGDVIATLKPVEGTELLEMEKALENAELDLARMKRTPAPTSVTAMERALKQAEKNVTLAQRTLADAEEALAEARDNLDEAFESLEDAVDAAREALEDAEKRADRAESDLKVKRAALQSADPSDPGYDSLVQAVDEAEAEQQAASSAEYQAIQDLRAAKKAQEKGPVAEQDALEMAEETVVTAKEAIPESQAGVTQAKQDLADARKNDTQAAKDRTTEITKAENNLVVQRQKYLDFKSTQSVNTITSDYEGRISKLALNPGDTINPSAAVATIDGAGTGYELRASLPAEQAQVLVIGDRADVMMGSIGWAQAILREIREDKDQPGLIKQLVFDVEGDVALGQQATLSIYKQSRNFEMIVPNAAVRQDANGSFVLAMRQKNGPLGSRYTLERVSVTVLESDNTRSAISGTIDWGMPIVTAANKPVENGSRVLPTR